MSLRELAEAWLAQDPDPHTRAELAGLLDDEAALADRFSGRLAFGTAGLRAELGAGPMRMNRVVVAQAAAGLAAFLLERESRPSVVIGFDARQNSEAFARDTATLMAGAGVHAVLLPRALPTPVLAFAVRHLGTSAGVMVTASHNPPRDNGLKVYLGGEDGGAQIVPPADERIADAIARVGSVAELPRSTDFRVADDEILTAYVLATLRVQAYGGPDVRIAREDAPAPENGGVRFVYSAMHGVGWETAQLVFEGAGFTGAIPVPEQIAPDGAFPTVAFPNPEEPGAMDFALALAEAEDADLAIVNDPDADRVAVAIPARCGWRRLTGDEVGLLLGWRAAERLRGSDAALAASLVSSPKLGAIAAAYGLRHVETLTGFKWIARVDGLGYGYEEALGYLVDPAKVRDKDGISAALDVLGLAASLRAEGRTVEDRLEELAVRFGPSASGQVSVRVADLAEIAAATARLRAAPPTEVAGRAVIETTDFIAGLALFPPSDILRYRLADGSRIIVRPSGTEPKLKVYLDADDAATVAELDAAMRAVLGQ